MYCESIYQTKRFKTREVKVGHVGVGGDNPVRIQSMTTSNTRDVEATVNQAMRLVDAGCEIIRVTVQGIKEAEACEGIKNSLVQKGIVVPLVADIHFFPPAALHVADFVDKVRINPGNYADRRAQFKVIEYTDASYQEELLRVEEKFTPLVQKCKKLKRAMRIGTNHGSLSDRIMNRFGDTPRGMVESAIEFTEICRKHDFHDIIFSMKASNPLVMIEAYRLLVFEMKRRGWDYPLHLGVTEAGEGEDGRIKSAIGIGSLLLDGLGDTIRVSLTEDPWYEIDPCKRLIAFAKSYEGRGVAPFEETTRDFQNRVKRSVLFPKGYAFHRDGTVFVSLKPDEEVLKVLGCEEKLQRDTPDQAILYTADPKVEKILQERGVGTGIRRIALHEIAFQNTLEGDFAVDIADEENYEMLLACKPLCIFFNPIKSRLHQGRKFFQWLKSKQLTIPVILNFSYSVSKEDLVIQAAAECGSLLADGLGEGLFLEGDYPTEFLRTLSFGLLQAARMRSVKTDFISCPSCGRTLFDLQEVTRDIREKTGHLAGVKIAVMGCIVNGPGEMADADFGYVGSKPGMIDLFVGKECVEKNIPSEQAVERLIKLIQLHGMWQEPPDVLTKLRHQSFVSL